MPIVPSGEPENSARSGIGRVTSVVGARDTVSRMGAKEIETRIEAPMKRTEVAGSPRLRSPCAPMIPMVCEII